MAKQFPHLEPAHREFIQRKLEEADADSGGLAMTERFRAEEEDPTHRPLNLSRKVCSFQLREA